MSSTGRAPTGISGLGIPAVYGRRRTPSPPARTTARAIVLPAGGSVAWHGVQDEALVTGARTIARNALAVSAAQVLGKFASLAYYVVMARMLGERGFGAYTFALSLAQLMTVFAGFGIDEWIARTVARDADTAPRMMTDALVAKAAFGMLGAVAAVAFAAAAGYSGEVQATVALLAAGALVELGMNIFNSVFQG